MHEHAVVVLGGGPTGLMLAGELALAGVDVAVIERRSSQDLPGSRAGGLHARIIEVLDQRGIADRFLAEGQVAQVAGFARVRCDLSDVPTRHPYGLAWSGATEDGVWSARPAAAHGSARAVSPLTPLPVASTRLAGAPGKGATRRTFSWDVTAPPRPWPLLARQGFRQG